VKLFLGFLLACFIGGAVLWKMSLRKRAALLLGLCLLIGVGFFFFDQI